MKNRIQIAALLMRVLSSLGISKTESEIVDVIELPKDRSLGDWALPCFLISRELKRPPQAIAQQIAESIVALLPEYPSIEKVQAIGPYLNFVVNKSALAQDLLPKILAGEFTAARPRVCDRLMIEYSQPNTHKAFHVGHVRCAALGDIIIRILSWRGHDVVASNYLGDEGTHVAKCLWYYTQIHKGPVPETNRGEFLGHLYTAATDLLDISTLTKAPFPGVVAAKVVSIAEHSGEPKWLVVQVDYGSATTQVVTAAKGFKVGDLVPLVRVGTSIGDRAISAVDRKGVTSAGMLCAGKDLGFSEDIENIFLLPPDSVPGTEVAEIYRIDGALEAGASVFETLKARQQAVSQVLQKLERHDPEMKKIWAETKEWSMQELYECYRWLDCRFDRYFFESEFGEAGKVMVREYQSKNIFVQSQGAIGADLNKYKLGFCIMIKTDGTATYACRDIALAKKKFEEFGIDRSFYVVDSGQTLHFQQVFKCLELMGFEQASKCIHLGYAQVVRPDGKMSSRKGNVILFSELQRRLLDKINAEFLDKYRGDWPENEIASAAHKIALATMRYGMMNVDNGSVVVFDIDDWTSRTGNTGPYLLYACARIRSILRDAGKVESAGVDWSLLKNEAEIDLFLHLNRYHQVVEDVAKNLTPHVLCSYLYELSKKFSSMYAACSVLNAESGELKMARLCLVKSVLIVLEHGLGLLGIQTLERM